MAITLEQVALRNLQPSPRNARTHDKKQIRQLAESITNFGFTNPLLIDEDNIIIAGHGRLEAAKQIGMKSIPAIRLRGLSEARKRALMLADNKIALNAGWDLELLSAELADLTAMELDFDLGATGFEVPEIDLIIGDQTKADVSEQEVALLPETTFPSITQPGDLWLLRDHRVLCGDARNPMDYETLMNGKQASMGFADPPYNVPINGHVCGNGRVAHREFSEASGEMTSEEFEAFLSDSLGLASRHTKSSAIWFVCMDWRHIGELHRAGAKVFDAFLNLCVWAKTNAGMGSFYRSQHELVFVFRRGKKQHRNNIQLGRFGRNRSNIWTYAGVNSFRADRMEELTAHPTAKPVEMIKDAILDVSARGDLVLDPFLGAGATLMAAERCGRVAVRRHIMWNIRAV